MWFQEEISNNKTNLFMHNYVQCFYTVLSDSEGKMIYKEQEKVQSGDIDPFYTQNHKGK